MTNDSITHAVALCMDTRDVAARQRLQGLLEWIGPRPWQMSLVHGSDPHVINELHHFQPDGILAFRATQSLLDYAAEREIPLVDTVLGHSEAPLWVASSNRGVCRLAVDHLIGLGLRHFAYCGLQGNRASIERRQIFAEQLHQLGHSLDATFELAGHESSRNVTLDAWLSALPGKVGLFAMDDHVASRVLSACRRLRIGVPEQIALLGVGDDALISRLVYPGLSSIHVSGEQIGFQAAELLNRAMTGQAMEQPHVHIEPTGVTVRRSTGMIAVEDRLVESAMTYIRRNADQSIGVEQVAAAFDVSRRTLDRRFIRLLGRSVHEELIAVRMENACALLSDTQEPIATIAAKCGFATNASFSHAFHREIGCWPLEHRRRMKGQTAQPARSPSQVASDTPT